MSARWIRVQVAADETQIAYTALQLRSAVDRSDTGRLRQLADADEILRVQAADAVDQVIADTGPLEARGFIADVVCHRGRARFPRSQETELQYHNIATL